MDKQTRTQKIEEYGKAYEYLVEALGKFPQEMRHFQPTEGWSIHQIVVHITDSEANSFIRCRRLIAEPGSTVLGYDEGGWADALHYAEQSAEDALELFKWLRLTSYKLIKNLPEATWNNTIEHTENGTMTMDDWLDTYTAHISDHVRQMQTVFDEWKATNG